MQAKLRCRISRQLLSKLERAERFNLDALKKPETQEKFQEELNKKVGTISEQTIEEHWDTLKMTVTETAKEILGLQK